MKKFLLGLGVLSLSFAMARSSVDRDLENCQGDNTCMLKVIAELIEDTGGDNSNNNNVEEYVEFYHDDGKCDPAKFLIKVRVGTSEQRCNLLAPTVSDRVWGIRIEGRCADIPDENFLAACMKYAHPAKSKRALIE